MEFVTSQKKQRKIIHEGYVYVFQKDLENDIRSFECVNLLDDIIDQVNEHTHPPSNSNCRSFV